MAQDDFLFQKPGKKKNKFNAEKCKGVSGNSYDSKLERNYREKCLDILERAGEIRDITEQSSVELRCPVCGGTKYKSDFSYFDIERDETIWVDTKGVIGERFRYVMKMWKKFGPGPLHVVTYKYRNCTDRFKVTKEIIPEGYGGE